MVFKLTEPKDMPPPYQGTDRVTSGRPSARRFSSTSREMSSCLSLASLPRGGNRKRILSKPPPEAPVRYSTSA